MTDSRFERGMDILNKIDPGAGENIVEYLKDLAPDLAKMTIEFGFGDVVSRGSLDLKTRELLTIGMLGAMGTAQHQMEMHVKGALNTGATKSQIIEIIFQIAVYAGFPAAYNAFSTIKKIFDTYDDAVVS